MWHYYKVPNNNGYQLEGHPQAMSKLAAYEITEEVYNAELAALKDVYKRQVQASFEPNTVEIATGTRFNLGEYNYIVKEKIGDGIYRMQCETAGTAPNIITGELTPVEYIEGLTYGEIRCV